MTDTTEELVVRIKHAMTTMANDDTSAPRTDKRKRFVERMVAMRDCVDALEDLTAERSLPMTDTTEELVDRLINAEAGLSSAERIMERRHMSDAPERLWVVRRSVDSFEGWDSPEVYDTDEGAVEFVRADLSNALIAAAKQWADTRGQFVNETEGVDWMDLANAEAGLSSAVRAMGDDT